MTRSSKELPILFNDAMVRAILSGSKAQTRRPIKLQPPECSELVQPEMYEPCSVDRNGELQPGPEIFGTYTTDGEWGAKSPFGQPGDVLWVRECFGWIYSGRYWTDCGYEYECNDGGELPQEKPQRSTILGDEMSYSVVYRSDDHDWGCSTDDRGFPWRPSIHMPRWASRIQLRVKRVWVERVQEISEGDAIEEGAFEVHDDVKQQAARVAVSEGRGGVGPGDYFRELWTSIYAKRGLGWDANPWVWACEFEVIS